MSLNELITALQRLKVQTGSFACLGCGHEHSCGVHGCAIIREAAEKLGDFNSVFSEDAVVRLAGRCLKVEPGRLRELADADKYGRVVVLPVRPVLTQSIGSMLYIIEDGEIVEDSLCEALVGMGSNGEINICYTTLSDQISFEQADIGKTVFLTSEEAEKALEAMKDVCP
nr:MAG TPA: hypothetical protein [Caudoviricetes sp.]